MLSNCDFAAEYYGLPYMPPSAIVMMNSTNISSIDGGVNFAVAGASAVDSEFYEERGIQNPNTNCSLRVQMGWLKDLLPFFCATPLGTAADQSLFFYRILLCILSENNIILFCVTLCYPL